MRRTLSSKLRCVFCSLLASFKLASMGVSIPKNTRMKVSVRGNTWLTDQIRSRRDFATWIQKFSARRGYYRFARDPGVTRRKRPAVASRSLPPPHIIHFRDGDCSPTEQAHHAERCTKNSHLTDSSRARLSSTSHACFLRLVPGNSSTTQRGTVERMNHRVPDRSVAMRLLALMA